MTASTASLHTAFVTAHSRLPTADKDPREIPLPPSQAGSSRSTTPTQRERADAASSSSTTRAASSLHTTDNLSVRTSASDPGVPAVEPPTWTPPKPVNAMTAAHFGEQVAQLAKQTKIARNVMPMIVRGGVIASLGMFLFGHLAPLAIIAVMVGAVVGGYAIAKYMQVRQAKQFAAMGENNPLTLLQKNMPEDASAEDKAKLQTIVDFVEKGDVFGNGMLKIFREPYRAITKRLGKVTAPAVPADTKTEAAKGDAASARSSLSAAEQEKQAYLATLAAKA